MLPENVAQVLSTHCWSSRWSTNPLPHGKEYRASHTYSEHTHTEYLMAFWKYMSSGGKSVRMNYWHQWCLLVKVRNQTAVMSPSPQEKLTAYHSLLILLWGPLIRLCLLYWFPQITAVIYFYENVIFCSASMG